MSTFSGLPIADEMERVQGLQIILKDMKKEWWRTFYKSKSRNNDFKINQLPSGSEEYPYLDDNDPPHLLYFYELMPNWEPQKGPEWM